MTVLVTKRFIYFRPSSIIIPTQETYQVITQAHLHGWVSGEAVSNKIVLICNSNRGNMSHAGQTMKHMSDLGYRVCTFDYSGFGKSWGIPSEQQFYEDASYMVSLLGQSYNPKQIILYGYGLGATVATYAARRYGIPTLILVSPFPDITHTLSKPLKYLSMLFQDFKIVDYLRGYKGRSLLIHSQHDKKVPYSSVTQLITHVTLHIPTTGTRDVNNVPWDSVKRFIEER